MIKVIAAAGRAAGLIAAALLAILTFLTIADICGRFFFTKPINGVTELTEYMVAIIAFFAIAWAALTKRHVKVDLVMSHFPPNVRAIADIITGLFSAGICAIIAWRLIMEGVDLQGLNQVSTSLDMPKYPFYYVAGLGCALLTLVMVTDLVQHVILTRGAKQ
jgi:TRAP-type C4-dicarboxylate transport system permease small subunit